MTTAVIAPPLPDAPYRGIEPFRFTDQQIFAAREAETWALLSNVTLYRAVLLFGESGTGKSSLVNAGFLPQVLKENYVPDRLRVQPIAGREFKVERIRMSTEGDQPTYLPSNFVPSEGIGPAESFELSLKDFRVRLEEFRPEFSAEAPGGLFLAPRSTPRPLLIFDQFEEFITLFEEAQRVGTSAETTLAIAQVPAAQQDILATLVELIQDETLPVKIIFSFREDYLAKLSILFDLCPELLYQAQRLLPPGIEALAQIIRAPFTDPALRAHFLQQKGGAGSELSEKLAKEIAQELGRRSKGDTANLTELQIVCQRLWEANDPEKLFTEDGIEGLLTGYGADVFRHFTPELRSAAVVLLSHMVTASNTRNIVSEEDLLSRTTECDFNTSQCSDALAALSRSQIVRREPRHSIYFYEITSEYLVPWIKEQIAERKSTEERRLAEEAQRKLEAERAEAVKNFQAQKHRALVFARVLAAMILLLVITVGLTVLAYRWYQTAAKAQEEARNAKQQTEQILNALKLVTSKDQDKILQGIAQIDILIKENKIPADLAAAVLQPTLASQDKTVHQAGYDLVLRAEQSNPSLTESLEKAAETNTALAQKIPARFYIHISDESQRGKAKQLAATLKKQGYLVPEIENVGDKGVRNNQLRYFRESDPGIPTPQEIVTILDNANVGKWTARRTPGYDNMTAGKFELWFPSVAVAQPEQQIAQPEQQTAKGTLILNLIDAESNQSLRGTNPRLRLRNLNNKDIEIPLSGTNVPLSEGSYDIFVKQPDYKETYRMFQIKSGQPTTLTLKLIRDSRPQIQQARPTPYSVP